MSILIVIFMAVVIVGGSFARAAWLRRLLMLSTGVLAIGAGWVAGSMSAVLMAFSGGLLIASSFHRYPISLSPMIGAALVLLSPLVASGEIVPGGTQVLHYSGLVLAGGAFAWMMDQLTLRRESRLILCTIVGLVTVFVVYLLYGGSVGSMLHFPISTATGEEVFLVARGMENFQAIRWFVPIPYTLVAVVVTAAFLPWLSYLLWVDVHRKPVQPVTVMPIIVLCIMGILILLFSLSGYVLEIPLLSNPPLSGSLEAFRPGSFPESMRLQLRPPAEQMRIAPSALVAIRAVSITLILSCMVHGLKGRQKPAVSEKYSLWPAVIMWTLASMLFAAEQVDQALDAWSPGGGAIYCLSAALVVAGLELSNIWSRTARNYVAGTLAIMGVFGWLAYWGMS